MKKHSPPAPRLFALLTVCVLASVVNLQAQPRPALDAAETGLALKRLTVLGSALYVGAHPDDENTALLAYLAKERGVRAAYLSLTRGDGGQNLIGTEKGELLGLLRTEELLAARRVDGAEQFFTRAVDFGFSKSPDEALRVWGHEEVLRDVVWVIRRFRPDIIITRFPTTGEGGHGHHTASAILAAEAFEAAADPARFPEQLRYVQPWKPTRLLWNVFRPPTTPDARTTGDKKLPSVDVGAYNALLGKSYTEVAALSRSMHKSQGFGSAERRGTALNYFENLKGEPPRAGDLFDGVDLSWRRVPGGAEVGRMLEEAMAAYRPDDPRAALPLLLRAHDAMNKLPADALVVAKRRELLDVIRACAGLWAEAVTAEPYAAPGGEARLTVTLVNRSGYPLRVESVGLPDGQPPRAVAAELKNNQPWSSEFALRVPEGADYSQPYWLRDAPGSNGVFNVTDRALVGTPENPPALSVTLKLSAGAPTDAAAGAAAGSAGEGAAPLVFEVPAMFRWVDRVRGEQYRPFVVAPAVAVNLEEKVLVFTGGGPRQVRVTLRNNAAGGAAGTLRLRLPAGWRSAPEAIPVALKDKGEEFAAAFSVSPPASRPAGSATEKLAAELSVAGLRQPLARGMQTIDYPHIPAQSVFPPAEARLVRLDLETRGGHVAYVMGSGDEIPEALRQVGYRVTLLSDEDLAGADLSAFDAVVVGVRAYNTRPRLRATGARLLEYVERGGTLVVQYQTPDQTLTGAPLGPYPFKLSQERVTDEGAPVKLLAPQDALLNSPNRITAADFEGWVQERGLYFPNEWDARYQALMSSNDPGEGEKRGGTLVARHGKGVYVYTAYAWFRQLPAGVPGAYRLFVNLISAGQK